MGSYRRVVNKEFISLNILKDILWNTLWRKDRRETENQIGWFDHVLGEDDDGLKWGVSSGGDTKW